MSKPIHDAFSRFMLAEYEFYEATKESSNPTLWENHLNDVRKGINHTLLIETMKLKNLTDIIKASQQNQEGK
ncbi:hypothetical protein ACMYR3_06020 [Ampullimonas aquatilis]|uniref:hypothetical protein n=1 Tax=Ampullimonas aquatilis TaxID=1341549 RepID=UPI003C7261B0